MSATLIYEDREPFALAGDDPLRPTLDELRTATGWERKPQGLCRGEACVQEPKGAAWYDEKSGRFDLGRFAAHMTQPVARDAENGVAAVGVPASDRRATMESLEAPDFALPDMDGRIHRLSDYRGKKVFLFSWGSY
jgi:hypothetical protein